MKKPLADESGWNTRLLNEWMDVHEKWRCARGWNTEEAHTVPRAFKAAVELGLREHIKQMRREIKQNQDERSEHSDD